MKLQLMVLTKFNTTAILSHTLIALTETQSFAEFRDATTLSMRRAGPLTFMQLDLNGEADDRQSGRAPYSIPLIISSK